MLIVYLALYFHHTINAVPVTSFYPTSAPFSAPAPTNHALHRPSWPLPHLSHPSVQRPSGLLPFPGEHRYCSTARLKHLQNPFLTIPSSSPYTVGAQVQCPIPPPATHLSTCSRYTLNTLIHLKTVLFQGGQPPSHQQPPVSGYSGGYTQQQGQYWGYQQPVE